MLPPALFTKLVRAAAAETTVVERIRIADLAEVTQFLLLTLPFVHKPEHYRKFWRLVEPVLHRTFFPFVVASDQDDLVVAQPAKIFEPPKKVLNRVTLCSRKRVKVYELGARR